MRQQSYSPYNRSYKFISMQNQLAHNKNIKNSFGLVDSNLQISPSSPFSNSYLSRSLCSANRKSAGNTIRTADWGQLPGRVYQSPRVVHRDRSFNKNIQDRIRKQNDRIASKLMQTGCRVVKKKATQKDFDRHKVYQGIAQKYDSQRNIVKDLVRFDFAHESLTASKVRRQSLNRQFCNVDQRCLQKSHCRPLSVQKYHRVY